MMSDMYVSDDMTSTVCRGHCTHKNTMYYATQVELKQTLALCTKFKLFAQVISREGRFSQYNTTVLA